MKRTINIKGELFTFEEENLEYATNKPISIEASRNLLETTKRLFEPIGLNFYLCYGTLLGAMREKTVIKGDEDVDVFTDNELLLFESLPYLHANGLRLIRYIPGNTYSFRINDDGYIDVYILRPIKWWSPWSLYCYKLEIRVVPKSYFREYVPIDFLGVQCMCPKDPEKLLAFWYGDTWRTPISGHKFYYEVKSRYYVRLINERFLKKILFYDRWYKYIKKSGLL